MGAGASAVGRRRIHTGIWWLLARAPSFVLFVRRRAADAVGSSSSASADCFYRALEVAAEEEEET